MVQLVASRLASAALHDLAAARAASVLKFSSGATSTQAPRLVGERTFRFVASDQLADRSHDRILADGWELDAFRNNPVILLAHDYWAPPVARAAAIAVEGGQLIVDVEFPPPGVSELSDNLHDLVREGYLRTVSVGFRPTADPIFNTEGGVDFVGQELMEISLVPVPDNPRALIAAEALGARTAAFKRYMASHVILPPVDQATFRAAFHEAFGTKERRRQLIQDLYDSRAPIRDPATGLPFVIVPEQLQVGGRQASIAEFKEGLRGAVRETLQEISARAAGRLD